MSIRYRNVDVYWISRLALLISFDRQQRVDLVMDKTVNVKY